MKIIKDISCVKNEDGSVKAVIQTKKATYCARLVIGEKTLDDSFNIKEPYDKKTHVFYLGDIAPENCGEIRFNYKTKKKNKREKSVPLNFGNTVYADKTVLEKEYDSEITPVKTEEETLCDGVEYTHLICTDKNSAPVHMFILKIDSKKASLYVGTPDDGYACRKVRAKVPAMIDAAVKNGVKVAAAVNADFFDIFGDYSPSGLCVKNGRIIANPDSPRPFIGIKKDGAPVITDVYESPGVLNELEHAAAGLQMIVKDGKPFDWAPLEPFSYVRHPRTAAGVTKNGVIILLVVDGRIPDYSNGASLTDLAKFMISQGADRALNLDGGGSSIVYTKKDGEFLLRSNPADLLRPNAKLIRKEFNCLLVVQK